MDKLQIVNAADILDTNFACAWDSNLVSTPLKINVVAARSLVEIYPASPVQFSSIKTIYFGNNATDLNLCDPNSFNYNLKLGEELNLNTNQTSFIIQSKSATLPQLRVNLTMTSDSIVHIKWSYENKPQIYKTPFEVPQNIIPDRGVGSSKNLSSILYITEDPYLQINVLADSTHIAYTIYGLILDQYLNVIQATANQASDQYTGIFGLGERANPNFFFKDGVYSMWAKDIPTPVENGKAPGNNMYGTHPFYMYKFASGAWTGVFHNLPQAQDWYITNDYGNA